MVILKYQQVMEIIGYLVLLLQVYCTVCAKNDLTRKQLNEAILQASGNVPDPEIFDYFRIATRNFYKKYLVMFLAQIIYESDGFRRIEDSKALENNECQEDYHGEGIGVANKSYHGRGYLMLTWAGNYKAASQDLFGNPDILLQKPELLALNKTLAIDVSVWYWKTLVEPVVSKKALGRYFGISTKIISNMRGYYECDPNDITGNRRADERFGIYRILASVLGAGSYICSRGCYY